MVKKTVEQKETINNLEKFSMSREEVINFFRDYSEMLSDANYDSKQNRTEEKGLKILTPKTNASKFTNSSCTSKSW